MVKVEFKKLKACKVVFQPIIVDMLSTSHRIRPSHASVHLNYSGLPSQFLTLIH